MEYKIERLTVKDNEQTSRIANLAMEQHKSVYTEEEKQEIFSPQKYKQVLNNPLGFYFGTFNKEQLIGFIGGGFLKNPKSVGAFITQCFILPQYQKHGIGRALFKVLEETLFKQKDHIWIEGIRADLEFFLKLGYRVKPDAQSINQNLMIFEKVRPPSV